MANTTPQLDWGPKVLRRWVNDVLVPWCRSGRPLRSENCEIDERPAGTIIRPITRGGGRGGGTSARPFQIVDASTSTLTQARVVGSTLANELPTGFELGDDPPFLLRLPGAAGYIYGIIKFAVKGHISGSGVSGVYQGSHISAPTPAAPPVGLTTGSLGSSGTLTTNSLTTSRLEPTRGGLTTHRLSSGDLD